MDLQRARRGKISISRLRFSHQRIPLSQLIPNPDQPRKHFDPVKLRELAESIRERGLIQTITVRPVDGKFMIVGGERRWHAHQMIEAADILCEVRQDRRQ
ncbi:ParB/RepB/Spo0J family partition protein [Mesorhizobium sp. M7A.F.Ca.US.001.04.1.1]|nr:ParB/RepB/Spo0J family partition protein [Mesorhizobium sp. M7A.F.Ca.US.001.04.2.1]RUY40512.1 ParB/RepB/Spo0J family partition protein [Mesorhizobium sp. M7A.F.Ca.US.001.04.1.1]RVA02508.1 ParB/RepB/Spo0J family partition protein [Mesorhizobium sp. M7A.F.Ca.US.001.02.1.1]